MVTGIIGAGASGMAAALAAAENESGQVVLMERQARVGRKLQATGNGRCNLSNLHGASGGYHGENPGFADYALRQFPPTAALEWFRSLGLLTVAEDSGRVYPYSDQANSVVDVLRFALEKPNITVKLGFEAKKVKKTASGFCIISGDETVGGSMSGYQILRSFGHSCTRLRPALVQLKSSWNAVTSLKGVRANCHAVILHDGKRFSESTGELQFTQYGLSGPVIFEVSRDVCQGGGEWLCRLDFLPDMAEDALISELKRRRTTNLPVSELFTGILHNRLGRVLTQTAGISPSGAVADLSDEELRQAAQAAKALAVHLTEPMGMDSAQETAGGILTSEFDETTMESRLVPGLYACGEVLDIDGDCGGYNLQWAWSSGRLAGQSAGRNDT